jgi:light-regulated signal transduction histidine kinase (bacteriophytochrome)
VQRKPSQEELQGMMPAEGTPQRMHRSFGSQHHLDIGGELYQIRPYSVLIREVEELTEKVEELERRKDAVEGFAAVAAHELMEPLVMTEAYAALIGSRLEGPQHSDTLRDLDALGRGAARMRRLIETLLHDARSAESPLVRKPVELEHVVGDLLATLAPEITARGADVEVGPLPRVYADEQLIGALFQNLLVNALKYSPRDRSRIRVDAIRGTREWRFEITSDGPVIPATERERIFRAYSRGSSERRERGAGLGLTICRSIVERHGGMIGVRAGDGGAGNCFFFTLPDA